MESRTFDSILRFPWLGGVGNTYPFCAPPLRFRPVHADECPWFDYLTVTGKFEEHNRGPIPPPRISHHLCNTEKENRKTNFLPWKLFRWWNLTLSVVFKITQNDRNHWTFTWTFHFLTCDIDLEVSGKNTCLALKCNSWSVSRLPGSLAGTTWCPTWLFATEFGLPSEQPVLFSIKVTYKLESKET